MLKRLLAFAIAVVPATATAQPLRVAITQEIANLTPYSAGVPENLLELVYDKLAGPSPYLANATPWLAESITSEGHDGRTWQIRLRNGIRWHDSKPFAADDVAFTLRYYRDGPANRWTHHVSDTPRLEHIEVLERLALRVRCAQPCPQFDKVTAADLPILPMHIWAQVKQPHRYRGPVIGTGPYRLSDTAPGRYMRLEANPDYFGGKPLVDSIILSTIRNPVTAFTALRAGELDLVGTAVPPELKDALSQRADLALMSVNPLNAVEMRINFERKPFSDPAFRRALALAIDTEEILQRVRLGRGRPGRLGYPHPDSPWTTPGLSQTEDDPEASARKFDALGFIDNNRDGWRDAPDGSPLRFSLKVSSNEPLHLRAAQVVARQLERVGIRLRVEALDQARHRALFSNRQFDLMIGEIGPHGVADPDQLLQSFRSGYLWRDGLANPALDAVLDAWLRAATPAARLEAGHALQRLHRQAPTTLVLYYPDSHWAFRPQRHAHWRALAGQGIFHKWSLLQPSHPVAGVVAP
jgi:peptide/nickel transport system substrate-binding protein